MLVLNHACIGSQLVNVQCLTVILSEILFILFIFIYLTKPLFIKYFPCHILLLSTVLSCILLVLNYSVNILIFYKF